MKDFLGAAGLADASVGQLLGLYSNILGELRDREVLRTNNPPVGDYAEWLVARGLGVERLEANSTATYDLGSDEFGKVQVKSRIVSSPPTKGQFQTSPFRSDKFDHAALVLINVADYTVQRAVMLPVAVVKERWNWRKNVNGWTFNMTPPKLTHDDAVDITERLRLTAQRFTR